MNTFNDREIEIYYNKFKKVIFSYIKNLCKSDCVAEECAHEALFRLSKQDKNQFSSEDCVKKWLFTVSKNFFLKRLKKESKYVSLDENFDKISEDPSAEENILSFEQRSLIFQKIQKTFKKMKPRQKQALELKFLSNLPKDEIIKKLNAPNSNTYYVLVNLAKKRFKQFWEKNLTSKYS